MTRIDLPKLTRIIGALGMAASLAAAAAGSAAQSFHLVQYSEPNPLLLHNNSQGYLGVDLADVDADHLQALKLKDLHGAIVTLIDHDAPAGKVGLHVNDV